MSRIQLLVPLFIKRKMQTSIYKFWNSWIHIHVIIVQFILRHFIIWTKRPKMRSTCITHMWSNIHDHLAELFIIRRESLVFFGEMSHILLQGHELRRLGARYWLGAPNGWDTTGRPQVLDRNVGDPIHPIFIGSTRWSYLHP